MSMQHPRSGGGQSSKTSAVTSASAPTNTLRFDFHRLYRTVSHARTASSLATATAPARCCWAIGRCYTSKLLRSARMRNVTRPVTAGLGLVRKGSDRRLRNRVRADQQVDSHLPLALHLDCAALAQLKPMSQAFVGPLGHLDRAGQRVRFHAAGGVDGVAPKVVAELRSPDHACND